VRSLSYASAIASHIFIMSLSGNPHQEIETLTEVQYFMYLPILKSSIGNVENECVLRSLEV